MKSSQEKATFNPVERLIKTLRCPLCTGLFDIQDNESILCASCGNVFSTNEDIPDLFVEAEPSLEEGNVHPFPQFLVSPVHIARRAELLGADRISLNRLINPRQSAPIRWRKTLTSIRVLLWGCLCGSVFIHAQKNLLILVAIVGFAADFLWLHFILRRQYRFELAQLLACARRGEFHEKNVKDPLTKADQPDFEEVAEDRPTVIGAALSGVDLLDKTVLHVGCGGQHDADLPQVYVDRGARLIGLDVYRPAIIAFKNLFAADVVLAEALRMPFDNNCMDFTNCTDIIEHVHDPMKFLQENLRVLKPGGQMLLITPNRFRVRRSFSVFNPFVFMLPLLGRLWPSSLFPREVIASRMLPMDVDPSGRVFVFFHTSFTSYEMRALLLAAGFEIKWLRVKAYRGRFRRFRRWLEWIPLLADLNDSVFAIARKPLDAGRDTA